MESNIYYKYNRKHTAYIFRIRGVFKEKKYRINFNLMAKYPENLHTNKAVLILV